LTDESTTIRTPALAIFGRRQPSTGSIVFTIRTPVSGGIGSYWNDITSALMAAYTKQWQSAWMTDDTLRVWPVETGMCPRAGDRLRIGSRFKAELIKRGYPAVIRYGADLA
jgi:hypothetical protein